MSPGCVYQILYYTCWAPKKKITRVAEDGVNTASEFRIQHLATGSMRIPFFVERELSRTCLEEETECWTE